MHNDLSNYVRGEVLYRGTSSEQLYHFWKCRECGREFKTTKLTGLSGLCFECLDKYQKEKAAKAKAKALKTALGTIRQKFRKKFNIASLPTVVVDGEKYYQEKAFKKALDEIFNEIQEKKDD